MTKPDAAETVEPAPLSASDRLYKVTALDGSAQYAGSGQWSLPVKLKTRDGWRPGDWMPMIKGELIACQTGYHLCREKDIIDWLGPSIHVAEYKGELVAADNKVIVRNARLIETLANWNEKTARLFAADCAERAVEKYWTNKNDDRPAKAIQAARDFANGKIDDAARDAAGAAARDPAGAAAWAARDAARDAAGAAAWAAAGAAAWAARDAAGAAAGAAAWDAAGDAAGAAAWAAGAAAWDAAGDAERKWQTKLLMKYLDGSKP